MKVQTFKKLKPFVVTFTRNKSFAVFGQHLQKREPTTKIDFGNSCTSLGPKMKWFSARSAADLWVYDITL